MCVSKSSRSLCVSSASRSVCVCVCLGLAGLMFVCLALAGLCVYVCV